MFLIRLIGLILLSFPIIAHSNPNVEVSPHSTKDQMWVKGRILVKAKAEVGDEGLDEIMRSHQGKRKEKINQLNVHIFELPENANEKAIAAVLAKNPKIEFAEVDQLVSPDFLPNDPYYSSAWHILKLKISEVNDLSQGDGITIAILDSGVNSLHLDLAPNIASSGWNFYDNNSDTTDVYGHGTKVAGAAAAVSNNGLGVTSVTGKSRILPIRVTDLSGWGYFSLIASGATYAIDHGARVANASFRGLAGSSTIQSAGNYMKSKGGLLVVGSGNTGVLESFSYTDSMIVAAATDSNDVRTSWSSYGNYVTVAAPGAGIWTTTSTGGYASVSGTSFSSPITAGVIALMMAANPLLGSLQIESLLKSTALDLGTAGWDQYYGYGRVNPLAAVTAAKNAISVDTQSPTVSITSPSLNQIVKGIVNVSASASDNVGVKKVDLYVNGVLTLSDTVAPYDFVLDTTKYQDGNVSLSAKAYDAGGNVGSSSSVTILVDNIVDVIAPQVTIQSPSAGSKVGTSVTISAIASDNEGVISNMKIYINGVLTKESSTNSISYSWNTRKIAQGTYTILVEARDPSGNVGRTSIQVSK